MHKNLASFPSNSGSTSVNARKDNSNTPTVFKTNSENSIQNFESRSKEEIPTDFQKVFDKYQFFNVVQSAVFEDAFYSDKNLVVSAPTGSGKTAIFELAIVRLLLNLTYGTHEPNQPYKIIYVAPIKALCEERLIDWQMKFNEYGVNCISITGDSDYVDMNALSQHNLIVTTPEKWDAITRRWRDHQQQMEMIKLFLIDEVQLLNEEIRGSTLEAVISRMKIIQNCVSGVNTFRFIAQSATFPNVEDVAEWLKGPSNNPATFYKFPDELRPVPLKKVVIGFSFNAKQSTPFKFDIMLNYRLQNIILTYAENRPTLIFCSTRKSVEMTAKHISQSITINLTPQQKQILLTAAESISDTSVRALLVHGVACHHAGMLPENRRTIEELFRNGDLPVLVTTSTLAMGVNLPAHLVIIKSTKYYQNGEYKNYSESAVLQMIGRAGRPGFDTNATAVILTTAADKQRYENMICDTQPVESNLHRHLTEHLNSEVVLRTITDLGVAMHWVSSTFLYIRAKQRPSYYGLSLNLSTEQVDKKLLEMCQIEINKLVKYKMLEMDETVSIRPTFMGRLMAKYYIAFETMKLFTEVNGFEKLPQILSLISKCEEFSEIYLRVNDKKTLNLLNKCRDKETIRFPLNGKIKNTYMKINCLIQAALGNMQILEHSLQNESQKIMRSGERIAKCLVEYVTSTEHMKSNPKCYSALLSSLTLAKCFHAQLWENSPFVAKQFQGIGQALAGSLAAAGKTTFQALLEANPRDIERILNRKSPVGCTIQSKAKHLPRYNMSLNIVEKYQEKVVNLIVNLSNCEDLKENCTVNRSSFMYLLVGDSQNNVLLYEKHSHSSMMKNPELVRCVKLKDQDVTNVTAHFLSENWVGFDCVSEINAPQPQSNEEPISEKPTETSNQKSKRVVKKQKRNVQTVMDDYMKQRKKNLIQRKNSKENTKKILNDNMEETMKSAMEGLEELTEGKDTVTAKGDNRILDVKRNKVNIKTTKHPAKGQMTLDRFLRRISSLKAIKEGDTQPKSSPNISNFFEEVDDDEWLAEIDKILATTNPANVQTDNQITNEEAVLKENFENEDVFESAPSQDLYELEPPHTSDYASTKESEAYLYGIASNYREDNTGNFDKAPYSYLSHTTIGVPASRNINETITNTKPVSAFKIKESVDMDSGYCSSRNYSYTIVENVRNQQKLQKGAVTSNESTQHIQNTTSNETQYFPSVWKSSYSDCESKLSRQQRTPTSNLRYNKLQNKTAQYKSINLQSFDYPAKLDSITKEEMFEDALTSDVNLVRFRYQPAKIYSHEKNKANETEVSQSFYLQQNRRDNEDTTAPKKVSWRSPMVEKLSPRPILTQSNKQTQPEQKPATPVLAAKRKSGFPLSDKCFRQTQDSSFREEESLSVFRDICSDSFLEPLKKTKFDEKKAVNLSFEGPTEYCRPSNEIQDFSDYAEDNRQSYVRNDQFLTNETGIVGIKGINGDSNEASTQNNFQYVRNQNKEIPTDQNIQMAAPYFPGNNIHGNFNQRFNQEREYFCNHSDKVLYEQQVIPNRFKTPNYQPNYYNRNTTIGPEFTFRQPLREVPLQMRPDMYYGVPVTNVVLQQQMGNEQFVNRDENVPPNFYNRSFVGNGSCSCMNGCRRRQNDSNFVYYDDAETCLYQEIPREDSTRDTKQFLLTQFFNSMQ